MTSQQKRNICRWYDFLRSGKYRQGYGQLAQGRGRDRVYCCLGVACKAVRVCFRDSDPELPVEAVEALGVNGSRAWLRKDKGTFPLVTATSLNDDYRLPFRRIAAAVRRTYPEAWR